MVSRRREQGVAVFPWLVLKASSLYCTSEIVLLGNGLVVFGSGGVRAAAPHTDYIACAFQTLFALSSRQN